MAYYFDHSRTKEDNPAAEVDNPGMVFLVTIGVSFAHLGDKAIYVHMLIAAVQVSLVAYYWMHLKRSDSLTWLTALSGIFIMLILFALPLGDYLTRFLGAL